MRYYLILLFVFEGFRVSAQDCNSILVGEVYDFHDNRPLDGATVTITGKDRTTLSKEDGKFSFRNLCDGVLELEISHPSCTTKFVVLTIKGDTFEKCFLEHHLEELEEVKDVGNIP